MKWRRVCLSVFGVVFMLKRHKRNMGFALATLGLSERGTLSTYICSADMGGEKSVRVCVGVRYDSGVKYLLGSDVCMTPTL